MASLPTSDFVMNLHTVQADYTHLQLLLQPSLTSWLQQPGATAELLRLPMALAATLSSAGSSSSNAQTTSAGGGGGGLGAAVAAAAELMGATAGAGGAAGWQQQLLRLAVSRAVLQLGLSLVR